MAPILELHSLETPKRAGEVARLVQRLYRDGQRVVVWMSDPGRRQILDDYLWTFHKLAFLPHLSWSPAQGEVEDPVVLVSDAHNPNRAEVLVVGDGFPPREWIACFAAVHDLIEPGEAGEERTRWWGEWRSKHSATDEEGSA